MADPLAPLTLTAPGIAAQVLPFGATLHALSVPDRAGRMGDVLVGLPVPRDHARLRSWRGVTVGRFANRIAGAAFTLDGTRHALSANEPPHTLHGGADGFDRRPWDVVEAARDRVVLRLHSPDGDQGFPGALTATATFAVSPGRLAITYAATVDRPCPVSLTSHGFFNLSGGGPVADHRLSVPAARYLAALTAAPAPVAGTRFDFRRPRPVIAPGEDGVDHALILGPGPITLADPASGRVMTLTTDRPALQLYTANDPVGPGLARHGALCLEPQDWPDAPNRPDAPDATLRPGAAKIHTLTFSFGTDA